MSTNTLMLTRARENFCESHDLSAEGTNDKGTPARLLGGEGKKTAREEKEDKEQNEWKEEG